MSTAGANERRTVFYSGRVQGVGFRYTARVAAGGYDVTGFVQNLDDGRVRLVVEGSKQEIERLLADIAERMRGYIRNTEMTTSPATGEFISFGIEH
jgi:acylphosphatase